MECLQHLLGDYGIKATTALYTLNRYGSEPLPEIARLVGTRIVTGSETEEGTKLAESRVKDITGGDTLTGRELYCSAFNFKPTHKLWIYGNHLPDIRGNDHGIWRRIKLVPFEVHIPDEEKDPELLKKLLQQLPGILNWAIKGCLEWQKKGLRAPQMVIEATSEYREEEDEIGEFLAQCCYQGGRVERAALHTEYLNWAQTCGIKMPMRAKNFAKRIRVRDGITELPKSNGHRYWGGISIPPCNAAPPFPAFAQGT